MYMDQRVVYMQHIMRGASFKRYQEVMVECKQLSKDIARYSWGLGKLKELSTDDSWTWAKKDTIGYDGGAYLGLEKFI